MVVVRRVLDVHLESGAEPSGVLVERRLEPTGPQPAAAQPLRRELVHFPEERLGLEVGSAEDFQRPRGPAAFRQGRALEHDRAGITARHGEARSVGTRVHPAALAERPAEARRRLRLPALHRHHLAVDVEAERRDEPARQLPHGEAVAHRQRARSHEALLPGPQLQAFDRPTHGIRPVEHPHRLVEPRGFLQHVAERRDEGVDAAAQILQIDEQHVEAVHHRRRRAAHRSVEAEDRNAVHRIHVIGGLDHVVLLVTAQPMLRTERSAQAQAGEGRQRIERMRQVARHGGGVRQQRHAAPGERLAER